MGVGLGKKDARGQARDQREEVKERGVKVKEERFSELTAAACWIGMQ